jgi:hypothetical protein
MGRGGPLLFDRAHREVTVIPATVRADEDASADLLKLAKPRGAAILWLYDTNVHGTAARSTPPRIDRLDPTWRCRNYDNAPIGVLACYPTERQAHEPPEQQSRG